MSKIAVALLIAATNCPLVNVEGLYRVQLITENPSDDCPIGGGGKIRIQPDGLMVPPDAFQFGGGFPGKFGGRVEPGTEPMQWVGTSGHEFFVIEYEGTWRRGQLSGKFKAQGRRQGKSVECQGKVSGFKQGK
jgi:hypothetical protein